MILELLDSCKHPGPPDITELQFENQMDSLNHKAGEKGWAHPGAKVSLILLLAWSETAT